MGYGSYDRGSYKALTDTRVSQSREDIFKQSVLHPEMDPKGVRVRESRDSDKHPESIGVIFALDETGSMRDIPEYLAREELPSFMELILDGGFVKDPQVMCVGIGDATTGEPSALQVGQYESEAELMDKWLTLIHLVGQGGGNRGESYDLAFYFAARHTSMDCWEKRGKKGYLFVTGDEPPFDAVDAAVVRRLIGGKIQGDIPLADIIAEASQTFHPFFLIPNQERRTYQGCERRWRAVLGDRVICLETPKDTCIVAATLMGLTEGTFTLADVGEKLTALGRPKDQVARVIKAVTKYAETLPAAGAGQKAPEKRPNGRKSGGKAAAKPGGPKKPGRY